MKLIFNKFSGLILIFALLFTACENEETITITEPDAAFELLQPGISNILLNFGLQSNAAFTVTWNDDVTGSSSYTIQMAITDDFANPITLGNSSTNSFTISVTDLNMAINSANPANLVDVPVFVRVDAGAALSNSVLFFVTAYPENPAEITSPAANDTFVLSLATSGDIAMTVAWEDEGLTGPDAVEYTIEAALGGTDFANPVVLGTTSNGITTLDITHADLNAAALGLGAAADVAADVDIRIVARSTNANENTLERISDSVTVSITPYSVTFPFLYLVGDATTPGWNNNNNNTAIFRNQDVPNNYIYTGYFNAGAFKLLEVLGQWQPQWGTNDGSTLAVNPGGGSDPGVFSVGSAGYYTYSFTTVGEGGSFTVQSYDASSAPTYNRIGLIGQAIGGWGDADEIDLTQDPNNPHLWSASNITFTNNDEFLIRPNDDWNNGLWRYTGSSELWGQSNFATSGNNFVFNGPSGSYDVWFNDLDGSYVFIPN
ncbi:MAG: SusF/SusE family outer membrane protein [Winogradskyella sp.]|uniref:SusE domain-containing protein n=1 Tax=Winogradskyella sp. TaxID=1883156 RepID=UPI000F3BA784|nr:SusE domain-containing protein [Winogradskyella sp.]RNC87701.1 MAG: SusF/SusE family outer membrane protein [Winogradskyella sp.]